MDHPELPLSLPRGIFKDTQNADAVQQTFIRHAILDTKQGRPGEPVLWPLRMLFHTMEAVIRRSPR
jgi:hypothetical protein